MSSVLEEISRSMSHDHKTHGDKLGSIEKLLQKLVDQEQNPQNFPLAVSGFTDAAGFLQTELGRIPDGQRYTVDRIFMWADGFTPGAAYVNAAAWAAVYDGAGSNPANLIFFAPAIAGQQLFPFLYNFPGDVPQVEGGNVISLRVITGPVSTGISVFLTGRLLDK
jgi:hypothetical protein